MSETQDQDPEWSLVETHTRRTRNNSEGPDSLGRTKTVRIFFSELKSFRVHPSGQQLIFMQKDGTMYVAFFQLSNAESFVNSLKGFIKFVKSRTDRNMYLVLGELNSALSKSFAELDILQEANTSDYVWKFVKNLHNRPYETTMEAFSKLADVWRKFSRHLYYLFIRSQKKSLFLSHKLSGYFVLYRENSSRGVFCVESRVPCRSLILLFFNMFFC